jgi:hypothetical protein
MRYHAISPYFVPLLSLIVLFIAFFYPNDDWQAIFDEPNLVFLNIKILFFVFLCLFFLYIGLFVSDNFIDIKESPVEKYIYAQQDLNLIIIPVLIFTVFSLGLFLTYLIVVHPGYIFLTFTGQASLAKEMIQRDEVDFSTLPNFAIPIVWWAWFRYWQTEGIKSPVLTGLISIVTILLFYLLLVIAARFALMPLIIGFFIIYAMLKIYKNKPVNEHLSTSIRLYYFLIIFVVLLFSLMTLARGYSGFEKLWEMILGYGPVSYNRLAFILEDKLAFEYSHTGVYLIPQPIFSIFNALFIGEVFTDLELWLSEFDGVEQAGINQQFIWLTQFGYAFDTLGYFSMFVFLIYGLFFGYLWKSFLASRTFGVILYPVFYFSIFFTFGSFYQVVFFPYYFFILLVLVFWEYLIAMIIYVGTTKVGHVK